MVGDNGPWTNSPSSDVHSATSPKTKIRPAKKLRSACDLCHQTKTKCFGGCPCEGCQKLGIKCIFSVSNRIGRPKGTRNKKTREFVERHRAAVEAGAIAYDRSNRSASEIATNETIVDTLPRVGESPWLESEASEPHSNNSSCSIDTVPSLTDDISMEVSIGGDTEPFSFLTGADEFWSSMGAGGCDDIGFLDKVSHLEDNLNGPRLEEVRQPSNSVSLRTVVNRGTMTDPCSLLSPASNLDGIDIDDESVPPETIGQKEFRESQDSAYQLTVPQLKSCLSPLLACNCLEQQAELLCSLKYLQNRYDPSEIDVALLNAQRALSVWRKFLECKSCQAYEVHHISETLVLSFMSIRIVLHMLLRVCMRNESQNKHAIRKSCSTLNLAIGRYKTSEEENMLVLNLLVLQNTDKIALIVSCLKKKMDCANKITTATKMSCDGGSPQQMGGQESVELEGMASIDDFDYMQRTITSAEKAVRDLKKKLQGEYFTCI